MVEKLHRDLSGIPFHDFVQFIFAQPVPATEKSDPWYWHVQTTFESDEIIDHYIKLFREPYFLLARFLKAELEQGVWAIQSCNLDCATAQLIWMTEIPLTSREECVRSMFHLFEKLFSVESLDTSVHMWWDSLCYDWHCGKAPTTAKKIQALIKKHSKSIATLI